VSSSKEAFNNVQRYNMQEVLIDASQDARLSEA
jgi:hypothetical protein